MVEDYQARDELRTPSSCACAPLPARLLALLLLCHHFFKAYSVLEQSFLSGSPWCMNLCRQSAVFVVCLHKDVIFSVEHIEQRDGPGVQYWLQSPSSLTEQCYPPNTVRFRQSLSQHTGLENESSGSHRMCSLSVTPPSDGQFRLAAQTDKAMKYCLAHTTVPRCMQVESASGKKNWH